MKKAYRVLAYLLAAEVVINGMAMAYAIAAAFHWAEEDGGVIDGQLLKSDSPDFPGIGAFMIHGMNGMMVIPLLALALVVVSLFVKVAGASRRAAILLGLVVLQVALGLFSHAVSALAPLHVLNGFALFSMAAITAYRFDVTGTTAAPTIERTPAAV